MKKTELQKLKEKTVKMATRDYLDLHPYCEVCGKKAITAHHFIEQSRSNYLRCNPKNLVAICTGCHFKIHHSITSSLVIGKIIMNRGKKWFNKIQKDSQVKIKDNKFYWQEIIDKLSK